MPIVDRVRHIIPISGKDSLCTAIVQREINPNLPYEYLFCDVGMELPETYAWLDKAQAFLGQEIIRIGKSLDDVIAWHNMLPSHHRRFCTREAKIFPIHEFIGKGRAIQYIGIRADEGDRLVSAAAPDNITFAYPLREIGLDLEGVYKLLDARNILPPSFFWKKLWESVWSQGSEWMQQWMSSLSPWVKGSFFSWRSRGNCFMCFYQRLYEWCGLLEHHPDLFQRAEKMEYDYGNQESPLVSAFKNADFTLNPNWSLRDIRLNAWQIFDKRVESVRRAITGKMFRTDDEEIDRLQLVSCGNYCGK